MQLSEPQPSVEVKGDGRKDSFELIPLERVNPPITQSPQDDIASQASSTSAASSAMLDMHELSSVLSESRAFDHSDQESLDEGATELIAMSEEPSGQYEGGVIGSPPLGSPVMDECADDEEGSEVEVSGTDCPFKFPETAC